jgi:hypothetical protein
LAVNNLLGFSFKKMENNQQGKHFGLLVIGVPCVEAG